MGFSDRYEPGYAIFVDEAGDPGVRAVAPAHPNGSSEWFTMSALVIDQARDAETVAWVRDIKSAVKQTQRPDFHYKDVLQGRRRALACEMLAARPCRIFVVASHKPNMSGFSNPRAEAMGSQNYFYNWILRVLLERVTHWVRAKSLHDYGEVRRARLVLSAAGGLRYSQMTAYHEYLRIQSQGSGPYLKVRNIAWDVLAPSLYEAVPHRSNAGVQLSDIAASAFYQAVNVAGAHWDLAPAMALAPRVCQSNGSAAHCGLTLMPLAKRQWNLDADRRRIFEAYGYQFE